MSRLSFIDSGDQKYVCDEQNNVVACVQGGSVSGTKEALELLSKMKAANESVPDFVKRMARRTGF